MRKLIKIFVLICIATLNLAAISHASEYGKEFSRELEMYHEILSLLQEREADEITGDFYRFIYAPTGRYYSPPVSILVTVGKPYGVISLRETVNHPDLESALQLSRKRSAYLIHSGTGELPDDIVDAFADVPFSNNEECFHPMRYWLEVRKAEQYSLIARQCNTHDGVEIVRQIEKMSKQHLPFEMIRKIQFDWFNPVDADG